MINYILWKVLKNELCATEQYMKNYPLILIGGLFLQIVLLTACKNESLSNASYDPNDCTQFSCPMHKDHTSTREGECGQCGMPLLNNCSEESKLTDTEFEILSYADSLKNYLDLVIKHNDLIFKGDTQSIGEKISHLREAQQNLLSAEQLFKSQKALIFEPSDAASQNRLKRIEILYAAVTFRLSALSQELSKQEYNSALVKKYIKEINESVQKLNEEHKRAMEQNELE